MMIERWLEHEGSHIYMIGGGGGCGECMRAKNEVEQRIATDLCAYRWWRNSQRPRLKVFNTLNWRHLMAGVGSGDLDDIWCCCCWNSPLNYLMREEKAHLVVVVVVQHRS